MNERLIKLAITFTNPENLVKVGSVDSEITFIHIYLSIKCNTKFTKTE